MMSTSPSGHSTALDQSPARPPLSLPCSLRYFLFTILVLTIICLGYSLVARWIGLGVPYSFPELFVPRSFFADFFEFRVRFYQFGNPGFFTQTRDFMYPPAMVLPLRAFYATAHPFWAFPVFLLASGAFFTFGFFRVLRNQGVTIPPAVLLALGVAITSYPYLFLLQRGNTEVFIWITVTLGLWSFYRGHYAWAAICFGLATALKLYPFIFFSLFLPRRRYREIVLGAFVTVAVTLIALRALTPHISYAFHWDLNQLQAFGKYYAASTADLGYDHSFFGLVKLATLPWHPDLTPLVRPYTRLVAVSCLALYFGRIWKLPLANQILILSVLSVSIPPVSYDYTLVSLYAPIAILCILALRLPDDKQRILIPYFMLYAAILTPQSYIIFHGARFGAQLRAICLLALLILALRKPLPAQPTCP
jgi:hypothetical protein